MSGPTFERNPPDSLKIETSETTYVSVRSASRKAVPRGLNEIEKPMFFLSTRNMTSRPRTMRRSGFDD